MKLRLYEVGVVYKWEGSSYDELFHHAANAEAYAKELSEKHGTSEHGPLEIVGEDQHPSEISHDRQEWVKISLREVRDET